jgi:hypothetical protein
LGPAGAAGLDAAGALAGALAGGGAVDDAAALGAGVLAAALLGDGAADDGLLAFFAELLQAAIARAAAMTGTTKRAPFLDMAMTGTAFPLGGCATVERSSKRFDDVAGTTVGATGTDVNTLRTI